jgi:hypothetical protein
MAILTQLTIDCKIFIATLDMPHSGWFQRMFLNPAHKWQCVHRWPANTTPLIREIKVATPDQFTYSPKLPSKFDMVLWYNEFSFGYNV